MLILSFESSCDETSVSVTRDGKEVLSNCVLSQINIFKDYGGVVPEIASREHVKGIGYVFEKALMDADTKIEDIDYIAVTEGPGLIGSLLTGINAAKAVSLNEEKPLVGVNHLSGHIYSSAIDHTLTFPLLALIISGGHTELVLMEDHYNFHKIGMTVDDAVGEVFDKVARILNLEYPGGPLVDKVGKEGKIIYELPRPIIHSVNYNFSFSGLKSAVLKLTEDMKRENISYKIEDVARSFEEAVADVLLERTLRAVKEYSVKEVVVVGGSAANSVIREKLKDNIKNVILTFPSLKYCGDNAAMIGISAYYKIKRGEFADMSLAAKSRLDL